ncbi:hypothetical protein MAPG_09277 [Magnaporthiopsis poae ATCC 64411]|uniref:Uncharacterized protein n=1 Tax=Magnaporthiopsis poae (strain ATCC 64411 / 73-15) TaxID=644358 RepID=A0A0C4E9I7_MAGP6|nr:hypothetical protein MAPG_09277 [Magnaporthiopsis poae ATCC 64411]
MEARAVQRGSWDREGRRTHLLRGGARGVRWSTRQTLRWVELPKKNFLLFFILFPLHPPERQPSPVGLRTIQISIESNCTSQPIISLRVGTRRLGKLFEAHPRSSESLGRHGTKKRKFDELDPEHWLSKAARHNDIIDEKRVEILRLEASHKAKIEKLQREQAGSAAYFAKYTAKAEELRRAQALDGAGGSVEVSEIQVALPSNILAVR